ncbi:MAG: carboxypeptidase regulatory-like domain-containing protein [Acidobacteria bacterium]|nr:carboxypeptidase regulatory-like domain-containing protein [Acidobacteriota bacterium]
MRGRKAASVMGLALIVVVAGAAAGGSAKTGSKAPASKAPTAANVAAPRPAAQPILSGTIRSSVTGRPIAAARVEVFPLRDPEAARERRAAQDVEERPLAGGSTDGAGVFSVAVPPGTTVAIVAEAKGHARSRLGRPVTVSEDRDLGRFDLPMGRAVGGKVVDAAGKPIAGAAVVGFVDPGTRRAGGLRGFARAFASASAPPFPSFTRTGIDGSFVFPAAPERNLSIRAFAPGMAPALVEETRSAAGVVIRMEAGTPLAGRVISPDGKSPMAGAWVLAGDDGWDGATRTGADGAFKLDRLRAGPLSITASLPSAVIAGESTGSPLPPSSFFAPSSPFRATLPSPAATPPLVLKLRQGGVVRTRALDAETREPIAGVLLSLDAPGEALPRPATTRGKGDVIFPGVPVGRVEMSADADGYLDEDVSPFALAAGQTREISVALRPAASIEGTVRDKSGRPIAGATVDISGPPPGGLKLPIPIFFPIGIDPVTTDAQGRFRIEPLPARSELKLSVTSSAFAPWDTAGIHLRPGERRKGMEVILDPGEVISGRVVHGDGTPVPGAAITASRRREDGPGGMVIRIDTGGGGGRRRANPMAGEALPAVVTSDDGTFRVHGVTAGVWSLDVESDGFAPKNVAGLKLVEGSGADVGDVTLEPGAVLSGIVTTTSGEPIPFARGRVTKEFSLLGQFTAEIDGSFQTRSLKAGEAVTLTVDADGFGSVEKAGLTPPAEALTIALPAASRISGTVVDKETNQPIPDFSVSVSRNRNMGGGMARMAQVMQGPEAAFHDDGGAFTIDGVDPGKIMVSAKASGYRDSQVAELEVGEGKDLTGVTLTLDHAAHVSGTIVDGRGRPVSGATVDKKETSGGGFGMMIRGGAGRGATSDGDGNFVLDGLSRERMTLSVTHDDYESSTVDVDTSRDVENLKVSLSRGGSIAGTVLHQDDGSPVDRATVTATAAGSDRFSGARSVTAGPDGAFAIEGVSAGRYTLHAEAAGLTPADQEVIVDAGGAPAPVELKLAGGVTLTGSITGLKEADLPQFTVRLVSGGFGKSAAVDSEGKFEMKGLSPGSATLLASSGIFGGKSMTKAIDIPKGSAAVEATIEFPRGNLVNGTVTHGADPIAGASVIFRNDATSASTTATTDSAGHYSAEDLESGDYTVNVMQFSTGLSHNTKLKVDGDEDFDIPMPVRTLTGRVLDAVSGQPIEGAEISAGKPGETGPRAGSGMYMSLGGKSARSGAGGAFKVEGLEERSYVLTAEKDHYASQQRNAVIVDGAEPGEIVFQLKPGEELVFQANDSASGQLMTNISAIVMSPVKGDPLAPGAVTPAPLFHNPLSADASNYFHIDSLREGTYDVVLGGGGVGTETIRDVTIPWTKHEPLTATLVKGESLEINVSGLALHDAAKGLLLDGMDKPVVPSLFFADPVFTVRPGVPTITLGGLKPGTYTVKLALPTGQPAQKSVVVSPGQKATVSFP